MRQHRLLSTILILLGISALFYFGAALYLPASHQLTFGVDKRTGEVKRVESGITFLPWHRFYRMQFERREDGNAVTSGQVALRSRDGVPVRMTYRLRFGIPADRFPDPTTLVNEGWSAWLRTRVGEAVSAVLSRMPIEEIASPTADYGRRRDLLRNVVAQYLSRSGIQVSSFEIDSIVVDREALVEYKRAELRRNARSAPRKLALITIEGADWALLKELMDDGRLPNLSRMTGEGATAALRSLHPSAAPMTWTSMVTGVPPDRHGVLGYLDARSSPVTSRSRTAPAIWEIAEAFGRDALVVNGWAAWPPSEDTEMIGSPTGDVRNLAYPPQLREIAAEARIDPATVGDPQLGRFVNITTAAQSEPGEEDPLPMLRDALARTWSTHRAALAAYRASSPELLIVNYETPDVVNHLFSPFHPPYREGVSWADYRKYWPAVANFYSEMDRLMGEWLETLEPGTAVMVASSHGFQWGRARLRAWSSRIGSLPQHSAEGVLIVWGEGVTPSRVRRVASVYDIAPTMLTLMGLPAAQEMQGQVLDWTFENLRPVEGAVIVRYDEYVDQEPVRGIEIPAADTYRAELQNIGHVIDPSQTSLPRFEAEGEQAQISAADWGRYAWLNNHAIDLRQEKKIDEALAENRRAIELNPSRPTPYLNRAMLLLERERYTDAEEAMLEAVRRNLPNGEQYVLDLAAWYTERDLRTRAINFLDRAAELFPQSYRIAANRGTILASVQRYTDAMPQLQRALELQPSSTLALNSMGLIAMRREDWGTALDYWNRSLAVDPRQPDIRQAAEAVRSRL